MMVRYALSVLDGGVSLRAERQETATAPNALHLVKAVTIESKTCIPMKRYEMHR